MKTKFFVVFCLFFFCRSFAIPNTEVPNPYVTFFENAYIQFPTVPRGVLEAVAFTSTHFNHLTHTADEAGSCIGMPKAYGVMGLILDGKQYFNNNLEKISILSGYSVQQILDDPEINILAYAKAYAKLDNEFKKNKKNARLINRMASVLISMSELPTESQTQKFAMNTQLYGVFIFMNNANYQTLYSFPNPNLNLEIFFGDNYKILSANAITISSNEIKDKNGNKFRIGNNNPSVQSPDYPPALWDAAPSCNHSNGRTTSISAVTIHDVEGSYAGCISWFNNCAAGVSAHYVIRSSDGQITQMVYEVDKAWHVGTENPYTIGIEHEGYSSQTGWYTIAMYTASAALCVDIVGSGYGINPKRVAWWPWANTTNYNVSSIPGSCAKIKGHQHYPNQSHTDPGPNWDWNYYYKLINPNPTVINYTTSSGTIYDSGGASGNYLNDERSVWTIAPSAATSVTLAFNSFNVENTWDYLYIYNGSSVNSPLIGYYTGTNSPGTIISTGGSLTLEFRSDCATTAVGWNATWTSNATSNIPANLSVTSLNCPNIGAILNWTNAGPSWRIDVSTSPSFTTYFTKNIPNLSSVACPGGFCDFPSCTSFLKFQPNTTYYWRIFDGSTQTLGPSFTTPNCQYSDFNCSGTFDDTGGPTNPYSGNENYTYMIGPTNALTVTISFTSFNLETNFDSLFIYDGASAASPLIGSYTGTNSPGIITSTDTAITLRFISDPFVNNSGFTSTWNCTQLSTGVLEQTNSFALNVFPNPFSEDLQVNYTITEKTEVSLTLVDVLGREILLLVEKNQLAGQHQLELDVSKLQLSKGLYFLRLSANEKRAIVKIIRE